MQYDFNLTVWQTKECCRCGGCCYAASVCEHTVINKPRNFYCQGLQISTDSRIASCSNHQGNKPTPCRNYSCRYEGLSGRIEIARAVLHLGTKPVLNTEEIVDFLEDMKILD